MIDLSIEYEVKNFSTAKTKNDSTMGNLILINTETQEKLDCKIWENYLNKIPERYFKSGNIIKIKSGDYNEQFQNCIVKSIKLVKESPVGFDEATREKLFQDIFKVIENFKNKKLKEAISEKILENKELFMISPAAKSVHHNYVGGLMQHIFECIDYAQVLFPKFKERIDEESILAACIMHDIGKMFEYNINLETGIVEFNEDFKKNWLSHTQYGFFWAMNYNFKTLARIIAAHHARNEWDALIDLNTKDLEPELYVMHHIDDLSAKLGLLSML